MLLQFSFKNFKSFKDEAILDLTATKENELSYHVRSIGNEKVLPIAVIYGGNASGKSNVLEAMLYMRDMVLYSLSFGEESRDKKYARSTPFLFDKDSANSPSSFEVYFSVPEDEKCIIYNYGFSSDEDGVVEEWLNTKARTSRKSKQVFYRSRGKIDYDGIAARKKENLNVSLTDKTLLVSLGARLKVEKLRTVFQFFDNINITNFGNPVENFFLSTQVPSHLYDDENVRKKVLKYFSAFDESIVELKVELIKNDEGVEDSLRIESGHKVDGSDEIKYIPLRSESAGTLKMFALFPYVQEALDKGGVLLVDELNARLHPLLVRTFVQLFMDPEVNSNNAQLIFTSHDAWQLSNGTIRRDEIWFTDKVSSGASGLYSLSDFVGKDGKSIRNDENFEKNYLLGKYGGIPDMKHFDVFSRGKADEE